MRTPLALLGPLLFAAACASANPRPPATPEPTVPPPAAPSTNSSLVPATPPPSRPVSSDPGVRTLQPPIVGGLVAETEPDAPAGSTTAPVLHRPPSATPAAPPPPPPPPPPEDGLGLPPAGPLPAVPTPR